MNIKSKKKPVIKKGSKHSYNPDTFSEEHEIENFYEVKTGEEMMRLVQPFAFRDRKFIVFDTEAHPLKLNSNELPTNIVRRWIGTGKNASPVDLPFAISIYDGKNAYTLYDSVENEFKEFKKLSILWDRNVEKIAHNTKFDMHMLANAGLDLKGKIHDTVVLAKLANENRNSFTMQNLVKFIKGRVIKFESMVDAYKKQHKINDYRFIPRQLMTQYANADVFNCYLEFITEYPILEQDELIELYEAELELMIALWQKERVGMKTSDEYEKPLKDELQQLTDEAEKAIYDEAGKIFNVNSTKQLYNVLIELGVNRDWIGFTDKGNPSLNKKTLEKLSDKGVSIVQKILEYRKYEKLLNTYAKGIYSQRDCVGKVHGNINQTEATTGRMSITKPALQTLPKKDKRIRNAFIPSDDYGLYLMDLDQIEYRVFAHYAQTKDLIASIKKGFDIHQATANILFNVDYHSVTEEQRTLAKTVNFSLIYGQGAEATARSLGMSMSEAMQFKRKYFAQIPEAEPFINKVQRVTRTRGYIKNLYGRRRRLKTDEVYKAPNALIQGCSADYIKRKIILIYKFLKSNNYKTRMVNVVHDELVIEVHKDEKHILGKLRRLLSDWETFRVPITAGIERGTPSWGEKEDLADHIDFEEITDEERQNINNFNIFENPLSISC